MPSLVSEPRKVHEITVSLTGDQLEAAAQADIDEGGTGWLEITCPAVYDTVSAGDGIVIIPADGGTYLGDIADTDDDKLIIYVELR
jgi:hypothetical protein